MLIVVLLHVSYLVTDPEEPIRLPSDCRVCEKVDDAHERVERKSGSSRQCVEKPVLNVGPLVAVEAELLREACDVLQRLRSHVVEVDQVAARVQHGEEQGCAGAYLTFGRK